MRKYLSLMLAVLIGSTGVSYAADVTYPSRYSQIQNRLICCFIRVYWTPMDGGGLGYGGERGIRTLETLTRLAVFKTAAFNHSATSPQP